MQPTVVRTPQQLAQLLQLQRQKQKHTQKDVGKPVGLLPKTVSLLENYPDRSSIGSLFKLCSALGVELVLQDKGSIPATHPGESGPPVPVEW